MTDPLVYTSRDLSRETPRVLEETAETGQAALITHHGRFTHVLVPLVPGEIEQRVLGEMAREIGDRYRTDRGAA